MDSPEKQNKPGKPPVGERFQPKVLMIWLLIVMGIFFLWRVQGDNQTGREILPMKVVIEAAEKDVFPESSINGTVEGAAGKGEGWHLVSGYISE
jgi:hypothetical protein